MVIRPAKFQMSLGVAPVSNVQAATTFGWSHTNFGRAWSAIDCLVKAGARTIHRPGRPVPPTLSEQLLMDFADDMAPFDVTVTEMRRIPRNARGQCKNRPTFQPRPRALQKGPAPSKRVWTRPRTMMCNR